MARIECTPMGCQPALFRNVSFCPQGKSSRADERSATAAPAAPASEAAAPETRCLRVKGFMRPPGFHYYTPVERNYAPNCHLVPLPQPVPRGLGTGAEARFLEDLHGRAVHH